MDAMAGHQVVHHSRGASAGEAAIIAVTAALLYGMIVTNIICC